MSAEPVVDTLCGPFNRERIESLRDALDAADQAGSEGHAVIKFEQQDLVVQSGEYLLQYLDMVMPK